MPEITHQGVLFRDYGRGNIEPLSSLRGLGIPFGTLYHVTAWRANDGFGGYGIWQWNGKTLIAANVPDPYSKTPPRPSEVGKPWGKLYPGRKPVSLTLVDSAGRFVSERSEVPGKGLQATFGAIFGQTPPAPVQRITRCGLPIAAGAAAALVTGGAGWALAGSAVAGLCLWQAGRPQSVPALSGLGATTTTTTTTRIPAPRGPGWEYSTSPLSSIANRLWQGAKADVEGLPNKVWHMAREFEGWKRGAEEQGFTKKQIAEAVRIGRKWAKEDGYERGLFFFDYTLWQLGFGPQPKTKGN